MKKMLTALLTFAALATVPVALASPVPVAVVMSDSRSGDAVGYDALYTECAWQGLELPAEALAALGDPRRITLTAEDLPANVKSAWLALTTTR